MGRDNNTRGFRADGRPPERRRNPFSDSLVEKPKRSQRMTRQKRQVSDDGVKSTRGARQHRKEELYLEETQNDIDVAYEGNFNHTADDTLED